MRGCSAAGWSGAAVSPRVGMRGGSAAGWSGAAFLPRVLLGGDCAPPARSQDIVRWRARCRLPPPLAGTRRRRALRARNLRSHRPGDHASNASVALYEEGRGVNSVVAEILFCWILNPVEYRKPL